MQREAFDHDLMLLDEAIGWTEPITLSRAGTVLLVEGLLRTPGDNEALRQAFEEYYRVPTSAGSQQP